MDKIPLFPLRTVLFPGMLMPINVFERRYLEMIAACQAEGRVFGVVLIKEGQEVGEPAVPHRVGTSAHVIRAERNADDGGLTIVVVGRERFVIREILQKRPYLVGAVEPFPLEGVGDPRVGRLARRVKDDLRAYMGLLGRVSGTVIQVEQLPDEPDILAWVIGVALQISALERQELLECADLPRLLGRELRLLNVEQKLLQFMARTEDDQERWNVFPFTQRPPN